MILWNLISIILLVWSAVTIVKRTKQDQPVFTGGSIVPITFLWFIASLILFVLSGGFNV